VPSQLKHFYIFAVQRFARFRGSQKQLGIWRT